MQGQKGYVNGYVVIIFVHYINCRGDGGMRENVTWASFFVRWVAQLRWSIRRRIHVGAGLLAKAVGQTTMYWLTLRIREQARSHS